MRNETAAAAMKRITTEAREAQKQIAAHLSDLGSMPDPVWADVGSTQYACEKLAEILAFLSDDEAPTPNPETS